MKKLLFFTLFSLAFIGNSSAVTYNFDSLSAGSYTETSFNSLFIGVSFNNTGGDGFEVRNDVSSLQPEFTLPNVILNDPYTTAGNSTIATFSSPTNFVGVVMGDLNADEDTLYFNAYDSSNNFITGGSYVNPFDSYAGVPFSISTPSSIISWVEFYGVGANNNSVFWDNFTFNLEGNEGNEGNEVSEPTTMVLLCSGLLGLLGTRKKFKK